MNKNILVSGVISLLILVGCATKNQEIPSNQTAFYWHQHIYKDITKYNFDKADDDFTSLEVEHPNSPYIPVDMLILAKVHFDNKEYELAKFYINEYEKRYASRYGIEWCEYVKARIKFFSITEPYTNQKLIDDEIDFITNLTNTYPKSIYNYELNTIKAKLIVSKKLLRSRISNLYKRLGKPKAAKLYQTDINKTKIIKPSIPWYKEIFYW